MGHYIIKIKDKYLVWSTVVDAPVTYGMTLDELKDYTKEEHGNAGVKKLTSRLTRVETKGTSSHIDTSMEDTVSYNRAGANETKLTVDQIYQEYCVNTK
jgi:hypothetical protein